MRTHRLIYLLLFCGALAQGATIAYDYAPQPGVQPFGGSLGMDFNVISPIVVTALGVFDSGADGLKLPLTAYIYNRSTTLSIASVMFPVGNTGTLVNGERFLPLAVPLALAAGFQGSIVAEGYGDLEMNGNLGNPGFTSATLNTGGGAIAFVGSSRYGNAGSYPGVVDSGPADRYGAGTFQFDTASPSQVPEPRTAILLGAGLLLLGLCRRSVLVIVRSK